MNAMRVAAPRTPKHVSGSGTPGKAAGVSTPTAADAGHTNTNNDDVDTVGHGPATAYHQQPPPWRPRFHPGSASLGYPDYYPSEPDRPDDVSEQVLRNGITSRAVVGNETFSAHDMIYDRLRSRNALDLLADVLHEVRSRRRDMQRLNIAPHHCRPPPRVTLTELKLNAYVRDLADPQVPLSRLARSVPHGYRGERLLEMLWTGGPVPANFAGSSSSSTSASSSTNPAAASSSINPSSAMAAGSGAPHQSVASSASRQAPYASHRPVSLQRALWLIRIVGSGEISSSRNRGGANYTVEWTLAVCSWLRRQLMELNLVNVTGTASGQMQPGSPAPGSHRGGMVGYRGIAGPKSSIAPVSTPPPPPTSATPSSTAPAGGVAAAASVLVPASAVLSNDEMRSRWVEKWSYSLRLVRHMAFQSLLDVRVLVRWIADSLAQASLAQTPFLVALAQEFSDAVVEHDVRLVKALAQALCRRIEELRAEPWQPDTAAAAASAAAAAAASAAARSSSSSSLPTSRRRTPSAVLALRREAEALLQYLFARQPDAFLSVSLWASHRATIEATLLPQQGSASDVAEGSRHAEQRRFDVEQLGARINRLLFRRLQPDVGPPRGKAVRGGRRQGSDWADVEALDMVGVAQDATMCLEHFSPELHAEPGRLTARIETVLFWSTTTLRHGGHRPYAGARLLASLAKAHRIRQRQERRRRLGKPADAEAPRPIQSETRAAAGVSALDLDLVVFQWLSAVEAAQQKRQSQMELRREAADAVAATGVDVRQALPRSDDDLCTVDPRLVIVVVGELMRLQSLSFPKYMQRLTARGLTAATSHRAQLPPPPAAPPPPPPLPPSTLPSRAAPVDPSSGLRGRVLRSAPVYTRSTTLLAQRRVAIYGQRQKESYEEATERRAVREVRRELSWLASRDDDDGDDNINASSAARHSLETGTGEAWSNSVAQIGFSASAAAASANDEDDERTAAAAALSASELASRLPHFCAASRFVAQRVVEAEVLPHAKRWGVAMGHRRLLSLYHLLARVGDFPALAELLLGITADVVTLITRELTLEIVLATLVRHLTVWRSMALSSSFLERLMALSEHAKTSGRVSCAARCELAMEAWIPVVGVGSPAARAGTVEDVIKGERKESTAAPLDSEGTPRQAREDELGELKFHRDVVREAIRAVASSPPRPSTAGTPRLVLASLEVLSAAPILLDDDEASHVSGDRVELARKLSVAIRYRGLTSPKAASCALCNWMARRPGRAETEPFLGVVDVLPLSELLVDLVAHSFLPLSDLVQLVLLPTVRSAAASLGGGVTGRPTNWSEPQGSGVERTDLPGAVQLAKLVLCRIFDESGPEADEHVARLDVDLKRHILLSAALQRTLQSEQAQDHLFSLLTLLVGCDFAVQARDNPPAIGVSDNGASHATASVGGELYDRHLIRLTQLACSSEPVRTAAVVRYTSVVQAVRAASRHVWGVDSDRVVRLIISSLEPGTLLRHDSVLELEADEVNARMTKWQAPGLCAELPLCLERLQAVESGLQATAQRRMVTLARCIWTSLLARPGPRSLGAALVATLPKGGTKDCAALIVAQALEHLWAKMRTPIGAAATAPPSEMTRHDAPDSVRNTLDALLYLLDASDAIGSLPNSSAEAVAGVTRATVESLEALVEEGPSMPSPALTAALDPLLRSVSVVLRLVGFWSSPTARELVPRLVAALCQLAVDCVAEGDCELESERTFEMLVDFGGFALDEAPTDIVAAALANVAMSTTTPIALGSGQSAPGGLSRLHLQRLQRVFPSLYAPAPAAWRCRNLVLARSERAAWYHGEFQPAPDRPWEWHELADVAPPLVGGTHASLLGPHSAVAKEAAAKDARLGYAHAAVQDAGSLSLRLFGLVKTYDRIPTDQAATAAAAAAAAAAGGVSGQEVTTSSGGLTRGDAMGIVSGGASVSALGGGGVGGVQGWRRLDSERTYGEWAGGETVYLREARRRRVDVAASVSWASHQVRIAGAVESHGPSWPDLTKDSRGDEDGSGGDESTELGDEADEGDGTWWSDEWDTDERGCGGDGGGLLPDELLRADAMLAEGEARARREERRRRLQEQQEQAEREERQRIAEIEHKRRVEQEQQEEQEKQRLREVEQQQPQQQVKPPAKRGRKPAGAGGATKAASKASGTAKKRRTSASAEAGAVDEGSAAVVPAAPASKRRKSGAPAAGSGGGSRKAK